MSNCNTCSDTTTQSNQTGLDLTKTFAEQFEILPPVGSQFEVSVASQSQAFLDANYKGLTHPVPMGATVRYQPGNWMVVMGSCYPTGCTPCDGEIEFPHNPTNGQRHCVPIGSAGETKCWVYDHCVPGWRAEGPATSPTRYRGVIAVCSTGPASDIQAGDWYISSEDCDIPSNQWFGLGSVKANDRIIYSGVKWEKLSPPNVPYASKALGDVPLVTDPNAVDFGKPVNDNRIGGIVKNATLSQALACTDNCDTITPYTLCETINAKVPGIINDTIPKPATFDIIWEDELTTKYVPIASKLLTLNVLADALIAKADVNDPDIPAVGEWVFKYYDVTDGGETLLTVEQADVDSIGFAYEDVYIKDFEITPVNGTRKIKAKGTFYDVYGQANTVETPVLDVKYCNDMKITTQPVDIDTQPEDKLDVVLSTNVVVEAFSPDLPFDASKIKYQWFIWDNSVEGPNDPDLNYEFGGWNTPTFTAKRTGTGAETVQLRCEIKYGDDHPEYEAVINAEGRLVITSTTANFTRSTRAHDDECVIDWQVSEPCLLKGPVERIIKETTRTVVERETVKTVAAPRVGSTIRVGQTRPYLSIATNQHNRITSIRSGPRSIRIYRTRSYTRTRSDIRLKKNIVSIKEFLV